MVRSLKATTAVALVAMAACAPAEPAPVHPRPPPEQPQPAPAKATTPDDPQPEWDSQGWTLLAQRSGDARRDRELLWVNRYKGKDGFDQLTIVVDDIHPLELDGITLHYVGGKDPFTATNRHVFRAGSPTLMIDVPNDDRVILRVELRYRVPNQEVRSRQVEIWGRDSRPPTPAS
jgi:hypothetical protein